MLTDERPRQPDQTGGYSELLRLKEPSQMSQEFSKTITRVSVCRLDGAAFIKLLEGKRAVLVVLGSDFLERVDDFLILPFP